MKEGRERNEKLGEISRLVIKFIAELTLKLNSADSPSRIFFLPTQGLNRWEERAFLKCGSFY